MEGNAIFPTIEIFFFKVEGSSVILVTIDQTKEFGFNFQCNWKPFEV